MGKRKKILISPLNIRLSKKEKEALEALEKATGVRKSDHARIALKNYLKRNRSAI